MAKKLKVNAAICDLRKMQEETLTAYESITIDSALVVTNPRARALLSRYPVTLNCAQSLDLEEDVALNIINGATQLSGRNTPNGKQYLVINGTMTVTPDAGDALRQYMGFTINGSVFCPGSLGTVLASRATINGKMYTYPEEAVVLKSNTVLDHSFLYRAQNRLYWAARRFIAVDPQLDGEALAETGARFSSREAILTESLARELAPLFDESTELTILPDDTAVIRDDLELTAAALSRYGSSLYVEGDLIVDEECGDLLSDIEFLRVSGDIYLPADLEEEFYSISDAEYSDLVLLEGHRISCKSRVTVDRALLEFYPEGICLFGCALVELDPELEAADILDRLTFTNCARVRCTAAQRSAVCASGEVASIDCTDGSEENEDPDTQVFDCAQCTL